MTHPPVGSGPDPDDLIAAVLELAGAPARGLGPQTVLRRLTMHSAQLDGVQASGILLPGSQGRPDDLTASSPAAHRLEQIQIDVDQGPCRDTLRTGKALTDLPLAHPHCRARWPHFTPRALAAGFTAATALPLAHRTATLGALNLFHPHRALNTGQLRAGQILADAAALALAQHHTLENLRTRSRQLEGALTSRILIEQAKGVLAERFRMSPEDAFELMRQHARANQMKMLDLARHIITSPPGTNPFPRYP